MNLGEQLNELAEAIEQTLLLAECDAELARQLCDLHVEIVSRLCPPDRFREVMGANVAAIRPTTMGGAFDLIASIRREFCQRIQG
ncbi:MAG TPA: hypothetical protein VFD58_36490 [Blastocatellia bacterium]|nr:hypothetical protein [Blastocatellia bacterium]